jgi:EthD domain
MNENWRMAFMFDARDGAFEVMEQDLARAAGEILQLAGDAHVRLGVADRHPDLDAVTASDIDNGRSVDGAVEISVSASRRAELPDIAVALGNILQEFAAPSSLEVMTGPYYSMVPVRDGNTFLSLAFRRDPAMTSAQFQRWWHDQHAVVAIPVLGAGLLAYDQVHVDTTTTEQLANAIRVAPVHYDAYDNLTWSDHRAFLQSISDQEDMARVYQDEVGRIDNSSRRHALMRKLRG